MQLVGLLLFLFFLTAAAQPGFTSIDCGGSENFISVANISWVTDAGFVDSGKIGSINDNNIATTTLQTVRYFPNTTSSSNCYYLPALSNRRYLLRASYYYGNYDGQSFWPAFNSYVDGYLWAQPSGDLSSEKQGYYYLDEAIWTSKTSKITVCLSSADAQNVPFISSLESRLLPSGSYSQFELGNTPFYKLIRRNFGPQTKTLRYPDDVYDRAWYVQPSSRMINTSKTVSTTGFYEEPPPVIFMSADEGPSTLGPLNYSWIFESSVSGLFVNLYFWDFRERVANASCMFQQIVTIDGEVHPKLTSTITLDSTEPSGYYLYLTQLPSKFTFGITFTPLANSTLPPVFNGIEVYGVGLQTEQLQSPPPPTPSSPSLVPSSSSPAPPPPPHTRDSLVTPSSATQYASSSFLILVGLLLILVF